MFDFIAITKEYGPWAALAALLGLGLPWAHGVNKDMKSIKLSLANVHDSCQVPVGAITSLEDKVHSLEVQDASVAVRLDSLENGQNRMDAKLDVILEHFAKKGMDS